MARLGLGSGNLASHATYNFDPVTRTRVVLDWAYRGSWTARAAVDCVAEDMTRDGVILGSELDPGAKADVLAACQDDFALWDRLCDAAKWGRLYGGAGIFVMVKGQRPETPLRIDTVPKGGIANFVVLDRWMLNPSLNDLVTDPESPDVGLPKFYDVVADAPVAARVRIHHSRFVRFEGEDIPYWQRLAENFWTLSCLEPIWDRLIAFDSTSQGVAQLVYKAHVRVLSVEGLRQLLGGKDAKALEGFYGQIAMMRSFMSNEGFATIDAKDKYEAHQYAFAGLSEVLLQFGQQLAGGLGVPLVRLFGEAPAGLNSTGDSDWENYDGTVRKRWSRRIRTPLVHVLLPAVAAHLGIRLPPRFSIAFPPLRQVSHLDKAEIASRITATVSSALADGVVTSRATALRELKAQSEETGIWASIDDADIEEAEAEPPPVVGEPPEPGAGDGFLPRGTARPDPSEGDPAGPAKVARFLPRGAADRRARARDAGARFARLGEVVGFPVFVETYAGSPRWDGRVSPGHYGYFDGTLGLDGDAVDLMLAPLDPRAPSFTLADPAWIVEKRRADGDLEQHKVFVGYRSAEDAGAAFRSLWGSRPLGATRELTLGDLAGWLRERVPTPARVRAVGR